MKVIKNSEYLLLLFFCTAFSCSQPDDEFNLVMDNATPVNQVIVTGLAQAGETIAFEVYFGVNNGCGRFRQFSEKVTGKTVIIKVHTKSEGQICHQALVSLKAIYTFTPQTPGVYSFRFWQADGKYLDKSITVN